jgi:phosphoglycerol transferase MdoB-like AlkP superfamily enzyme
MSLFSDKRAKTLFDLVGLFGFGLSLGVYAWVELGEAFSVLHLLDLCTFSLAFALVLLTLPRRRWFKIPLAGLLGVVLILIHVGFLLYFRFYQSWPYLDIIADYKDAEGLGSSLLKLTTWADLIFGLAIPSLFLAWAIRRTSAIPRRPALPMIAVAFLAAEVVFEIFSAYPYRRAENEPMMYLLRDHAMAYVGDWLPVRKASIARVDRQIERYFPLDADLYRYDRKPNARLRKIPAPDRPPREMLRPNIILIVLESMRAYEFGLYGAAPSFTPRLDQLGERSLVFEPFYGNTYQTGRAECAANCSVYESLRSRSIFVRFPKLKVNCLPDILRARGYHTLWINSYFAGFSNARGFLGAHGIEEFRDWADIRKNGRYRRIGWGPSDDDLYRMATGVLAHSRQPFYAEVLSLSNHFPYTQTYPTDANLPEHRHYSDEYADYLRGIFYTDAAVGKFIAGLQRYPWFKNTIVVVTGDHGQLFYPDGQGLTMPQRQEIFYRLPLLIYSPGGLLPTGRRHVLGSQMDIAPTIMDLLGLEAPNAFMGRSLLRAPDDPTRYVMMIHGDEWNIRRGDEYCYDLQAHWRDADYRGLPASALAERSPRTCFRAAGDLLHDPAITPLPVSPDAPDSLFSYGQELVLYIRYLLKNNLIYR